MTLGASSLRARAATVAYLVIVASLLTMALPVTAAAVGAAENDGRATPAGAASGNPYGSINELQVTPAGLVGRGWTIDDDAATTPLVVHVYDGSQFIGQFRADQYRPDVGDAYPAAGPNHGFTFTIPLAEGQRTVCAYAINVGPGTDNPQLGCRALWSQVAYGAIDVATRYPDFLRVAGWAADSDTTGPISVSVQVGGSDYGTHAAAGSRPDVDSIYGGGAQRGFDLTFPLPPAGVYAVCVVANGVGPGGSQSLGCRNVDTGSTQIGFLEGMRAGDSFVRLSGWTLDPDVATPNSVVVKADGELIFEVAALQPRGDVAAAYPGTGPNHGFGFNVSLSPGVHTVCAYASGLGPGPDYVLMGCGQVDIMPPGTGAGSGRRIVYANSGQWVWLVDANGLVDRSYPVSGRYQDPPPGEYAVYGKWRHADAGHDGITMEYFVGFSPDGKGYGFHTIPTYADGTPLQGENELGQFRSAGCVRQRRGDAIFLWNWSTEADRVMVLA